MSELRLAARGISKRFGSTLALNDVSFEARPGEVHAIVGQNGAGKSTLMNVLAGATRPDSGRIELDGVAYAPRDPSDAKRQGVAIVHQEAALCPALTVAENVLLGVEPVRAGFIDRKLARERCERALELVAPAERRAALRADARASELGPAEQQLVAIARALAQSDCRLLILDEPTSRLGLADTEQLFAVVRRLSASGITVLYISHFLEELRRIAERFTVVRDGQAVQSGTIADTPVEELVRLMAGRAALASFTRTPAEKGEVVLELDGLAGKRLPRAASLQLSRGEVLGIAGLVGSGRSELLRAVFGLDAVKSGRIKFGALVGPASPARRLAQGLGLLSEDRKLEGLALELSVADNLTLSRLDPFGPWGLVLPARQAAAAERWVEQLGIRCHDVAQPARGLSGGNQQKLALARLLHHDVDVLLLDEPTRGIDIASRTEIYRFIDGLLQRKKAVILVSSQFPELLSLCDRIAVMKRGVLGPAKAASELDEHRLLLEATGT
jgi:ribose transport system ATP-binding protein